MVDMYRQSPIFVIYVNCIPSSSCWSYTTVFLDRIILLPKEAVLPKSEVCEELFDFCPTFIRQYYGSITLCISWASVLQQNIIHGVSALWLRCLVTVTFTLTLFSAKTVVHFKFLETSNFFTLFPARRFMRKNN